MAAETYAPAWCPWAKGTFDREKALPLKILLACEKCGECSEARCEQGAPRQWVLRWAVVHAHRDPMHEQVPGKL